jgi:hypothetical protein
VARSRPSQPDSSILAREVLADQLIRWGCIDRLSWRRLSETDHYRVPKCDRLRTGERRCDAALDWFDGWHEHAFVRRVSRGGRFLRSGLRRDDHDARARLATNAGNRSDANCARRTTQTADLVLAASGRSYCKKVYTFLAARRRPFGRRFAAWRA